MITVCQVIFSIACFASIGVIYIILLEIKDIFKINDKIKEDLNVSKNKKEDR